MKHKILFWSVVALLGTAGPALAAKQVIGFVDVVRIQAEFGDVKRLQSDLEAESQKYDAELREGQKKMAEIDVAIASADAAIAATSDIAVRKQAEAAKADQESLKQKTQADYSSRLGERRKRAEAIQQTLNEDLLGRVKTAVEKVAKKRGLDGVIDARARLWGAVDLTEDVLSELNATRSTK